MEFPGLARLRATRKGGKEQKRRKEESVQRLTSAERRNEKGEM